MEKLMKVFMQFSSWNLQDAPNLTDVPNPTEKELIDLFARLKPREVKILKMRFGLDGEHPLSLREIGLKVGVSADRVRQIQNCALFKMHKEYRRRLTAKNVKTKDDFLCLPINYFRLNKRELRRCYCSGIDTIKKLVAHSRRELLENFGFEPNSLREVQNELARFRLSLAIREKIKIQDAQDALLLSISYLNLSVRGRRVCGRKSIDTIGELIACSARDLLEVKNCGMITVNEIREKLHRINLKLKDD